jgi:hypothetical protein
LTGLADDGAVIVESFLSPDLLRRLNEELDVLIERASPGSRSDDALWQMFHGANTKRFTRLAALCPSFWEILRQPLLRAAADALLLPSCGKYWMNTAQMMVVGPGEPAQFLHRDQDNWPFFSTTLGAKGPEITPVRDDRTDRVHRCSGSDASRAWQPPLGRLRSASRPSQHRASGNASGSRGCSTSGKVIHGAGHNQTEAEWRRGLHVRLPPGMAHTRRGEPTLDPMARRTDSS